MIKKMNSFNISENTVKIETYLSKYLEQAVKLTGFERLPQSTREAPWKLNVSFDEKNKSYVLYLNQRRAEHDYTVLRAMEKISIPTPRAYGWEPAGITLGIPCFFTDFIEGESLLKSMLAREKWAEDLYVDTVCRLQAVKRSELSDIDDLLSKGESALDIFKKGHTYFSEKPNPLAEEVYEVMKKSMPPFPEMRFSNGDLYPDNMIVFNERLNGVIDFETAGFSDPIFEFLLPFFLYPELCGRGIEEKYCRRMGFDPEWLHWYHGLEFYDTWRWTLQTGKSWEQHNSESLRKNLKEWLKGL